MNKNIFSIIFLVLILITACSTQKVVTEKVAVPEPERPMNQTETRFHAFFSMCERDIYNARKVVFDRDLIKILTHLHKMNEGGRRYYLLERESITEMIMAVTKGVYSDFILINKHGIIIYTRENDDIFGKSVITTLKNTALLNCFNMTDTNFNIEDVSIFPPESNSPNIFISTKVIKDNSFHGVFVLQVGIYKIEEIIDRYTNIISPDGICRVSKNSDNVLAQNQYFSRIDLKSNVTSSKPGIFNADEKNFEYYPFKFKNLSWIVITEKN